MAEIKAFKGIRYNQERVNLAEVVTQPYDKITPETQEAYYKKSPYNIVRIILCQPSRQGGTSDTPTQGFREEMTPYAQARGFFEQWAREGILIEDKEPSIYPYFQEFTTPQGEHRVRKGFVALLKIEDFSKGIVLPHERTLSGPKEDRLKLLRATRANFGQIFMLYPDQEHKISDLIDREISGVPLLADVCESYEEGVRHKLWRIWNESIIREIRELMGSKTLLIADGHHRYETALNYSKENTDAQYRMITFVSLEDPGLMILPTHRAVYGIEAEEFIKRVSAFFEVKQCDNKDSLLAELEGNRHTYGLYDGKFWLLKLKDENLIDKFVEKERTDEYRTLDITVLHSIVLEGVLNISKDKIMRKECIDYLRDIEAGIQGVNNHKYNLLFILNPTRMDETRKISAQHEVMPQKSTDFYPKLITGLVINKL